MDNRLVKGSDSNSIPARLEQLEIDFALADKLAIHYRDRTHQVLRALFGLAFLAVFCFSVYAHWTHAEWPFLVLNVCVVAAAYVVYIYAGTIPFPFDWLRHLLGPDRAREIWRWRRDYKTRYLDYRALAEGMRVQFFWCLIGSPHQVADHYLRKQRGELDWIRAAIRGWTMVGTGSESMTRQEPHWTALDIAERNWVRDQRAFFRRRASANRRLAEWSHRTVHCFILAAALLSLVLIWLATPVAPPGYDLDRIREILVVPLVLLSAGAALIEGYLEKTAVSEQAKQYERIGMVFERAASGLERARQHGDGTKAVRILEELGNEALAENGDWVLLHRARPMEVRFEG